MLVRNLGEIIQTERDVTWGYGQSRRFLLEKDGMGFSLTDTIIEANREFFLEYKNHLEACYCIEGEGEIEVDGFVYPIRPGTMYALDKHDKHCIRAKTILRLVCVFTPPLKGHESHNFESSKASSYE